MQFAAKPNPFDIPGEDIAIPGRRSDPDGGVALDGIYDGARGDIRLWVSYQGLRAIMRQVPQMDLAEGAAVRSRDHEIASLRAELDQTRAERDELQTKLDRIAGLQKDGFKVSRVMG